ncbi:hypothetical protein CEE37_08480 [candidate division LCP-89 bacterium B3_LCP]|uniref:Uncharacterized protein n=1 Tax=candidate division LCP-89 bacterium B3_LCP TaxID=2012998 RepID=A0A532UZH2_UNCL8|nr:MAG: hypothetical protein CEE37_08480 [candidate division LCP-89 bacterium B3_LCP]
MRQKKSQVTSAFDVQNLTQQEIVEDTQMSEKPLEKMLDRDLSIVMAKEEITLTSEALPKVINYSTKLCSRCFPSTPKPSDVAIIVSYMHIIEMVDAIEVLVSSACVNPAKLQLRSAFEGFLNLQYLIKDDTERRADVYFYFHAGEKLAAYLKYLSYKQEFADRRDGIRSASIYSEDMLPPLDFSGTETLVSELSIALSDVKYKSIMSELFVLGKRHLKWYQLYNGPKNLRELSRYLNCEMEYDLIYGYLSKTVHASNLLSRFTSTHDKEMLFLPLRETSEVNSIKELSITILLRATKEMINYFREDEYDSFAMWYASEIRVPLMKHRIEKAK